MRKRDPKDSRKSRVSLSEKGKSISEQTLRLVEEVDSEAFAGFSADEFEKMKEFLERIHSNFTK